MIHCRTNSRHADKFESLLLSGRDIMEYLPPSPLTNGMVKASGVKEQLGNSKTKLIAPAENYGYSGSVLQVRTYDKMRNLYFRFRYIIRTYIY